MARAAPRASMTRACIGALDVGVVLVSLCLYAGVAHASPSRHFDIPAQDVRTALHEFARQADQQILFSTETVGPRRTQGVKGELEVEAALRQLLQDTGLTFRVTADGTILAEVDRGRSASATGRSIVPRASESQDIATELENVVVTGTLIRGIAPASTNLIGLPDEDVIATGSISVGQLLTTVPQLGGFNGLDSLAENTQITIKRPNIRDLPNPATAGGSTTLVLLDGHRIANAGIRQTAADPDVVPLSVLERVEIIPDGGSATYGADAIGGVINFVTRRRFEGLQASGRYGFADHYQTFDANGIAGESWDSGSAYLSYTYASHDALFGRDRDYVRRYDATGGAADDLGCNPGNVAIGALAAGTQTLYALPTLAPNTSNECDSSDDSSFYPRETFQMAFVSVSQDFTEFIELDFRGFYSQRRVGQVRGSFTSMQRIAATNPFYRRTLDNPAPQPAADQTVVFSWEPVLGNAAAKQNTQLETLGITPTLAIDLHHGWQIRALVNVGRSTTRAVNPDLNNERLSAALAATTSETALDPYDLAATPNRHLLADITNFRYFGEGEQNLLNYRVVADGELLRLPGGVARLALGAEYMHEKYVARSGNIIPGNERTLVLREANRDNVSVFGELSIPIVGAANGIGGLHSLTLAASARYDDYSDFGDTTNPKLAITYEPVSWLAVRGSWGKSFNAPSLADSPGAENQAIVFPYAIIRSPLPGQFSPAQAFWPMVFLVGGAENVRPQTAETMSLGFNMKAPVAPGLIVSAAYHRILFADMIALPPFFNPFEFYSNYTSLYVLNPTRQQVEDLVRSTPGGLTAIADLFDADDAPIYGIADARRRNLGRARIGGLDVAVRYMRDTHFGSMDAGFAGTYALERQTQPLPGARFNDVLDADFSRLRSSLTVGANIGNLRAQAQWNHSSGFDTDLSPVQSQVGSFDVFNLYFNYAIANTGLLSDVQLSLNVNNVFDTDPPRFRGSYMNSDGYANGATLGRLIQFGVNKTF